MPCHLIVAHSNSWSSDTDKWTWVITLDFFVTSHSVKMASAQHVPQKTNKCYCCLLHQSLLTVSFKPLCCPHYHPSSQKSKTSQSLSLDLWYPSPIVPLPTVSLRKKWKSREWETERTWTFYTFQAVFLRKKNKLIKIQLSLTYSLLPFQSFYSFKSLTISMKLKGSSRQLWNSDTSDNNAFEEPVTLSPQTSLINAQTVFLFSLLLFSWFLSN